MALRLYDKLFFQKLIKKMRSLIQSPLALFVVMLGLSTVLLNCRQGPIRDLDIGEDTSTSDFQEIPELIFNSGFQGTSQVVSTSNGQIEDIVGVDDAFNAPNDWVNDFEGHPNIGEFRLYYEAGNTSQRFARIVDDPTCPEHNEILHFMLAEPNVPNSHGRIQADIYNNNGLKEIYQVARVYLHPDFNTLKEYPSRIYWMTIFELWNDAGWYNPEWPFRVSMHIEKPSHTPGGNLHFHVDGQQKSPGGGSSWSSIWKSTNMEIEVPVGQWMTMEIYVKEGDADNGRFYVAITPDEGVRKVIFDITNSTHHPLDPNPDGFTDFNPMKLYTSREILQFMQDRNKGLQIYWDDYELWKNRRPGEN